MASLKANQKISKAGKPKKSSAASTIPTPRPALSAETIVDSDSSSEGEAPSKKKLTSVSTKSGAKKRKIDVAQDERLPKTNGTAHMNGKAKSKKQETTESSEEDSEDSQGSEAEKGSTKKTQREDSSSDESTSEEEEESSDDGMELDTPQRPQSKSLEQSKKPRAVQSEVVVEYIPPEGFERVHLKSAVQSTRLASRLNRSSLEGKQIWHITVPEDVDISTMETISPAALERGATALKTEDGDSYTFRPSRKRDIEGTLVLLPDTDQNEYTQLQLPVSRTLDLQQVMDGKEEGLDLEEQGLDPKKLVAQKTYEKPPPPEQRQGLQVMNVPIGVTLPKEVTRFKPPRGLPSRTNGEVSPEKGTEESLEEKAARKAEKARKRELKEKKKASKSGLR